MAYVQKNNPFPKTGCGRRRSYMMTDNPAPFKQSNKRTKGFEILGRWCYDNWDVINTNDKQFNKHSL